MDKFLVGKYIMRHRHESLQVQSRSSVRAALQRLLC